MPLSPVIHHPQEDTATADSHVDPTDVSPPRTGTRRGSVSSEISDNYFMEDEDRLVLTEATLANIDEEQSGRIIRFIRGCSRLPTYLRSQVYMMMGAAILAIPLLVDYIFFLEKEKNKNKQFLNWSSQLTIGKMTVFHITLYVLVCWIVYCQMRMVFHYVPKSLAAWSDAILGGRTSEAFRDKMHQVVASSSTIALAHCLMLANYVLFPIFIDGSVQHVPLLRPYRQDLSISTEQSTVDCPEGYIVNKGREVCEIDVTQMHWKQVVANIQQVLLWTVLLLLLKRILIQSVAIRFHRTAYKQRIAMGKFYSWVLEHINHARVAHLKKLNYSKSSQIQIVTENRPIMAPLSPISHKLSFSDLTKYAFANFDNPESVTFHNAKHAQKFSVELYQAMGNGQNIVLEHFVPFFNTKSDARKAYALFDKDLQGDISQEEMQATILGVHHDRENLAKALLDGGDAIGSLDTMVSIFLWAIIIVMWAVNLSSVTVKDIWTPFSAVFFGLSFVFGNTLKNVFDSIIFMFSMHPYDVGDKVTIDNGDVLEVVQMSLLNTVFRKCIDNETINLPNHVIALKQLANLRRSEDQWERHTFVIPAGTSQNKLLVLRQHLTDHIESHRRYFYKRIDMQVSLAKSLNDSQYELTLSVRHKGNFQDLRSRSIRSNNWTVAVRNALIHTGLLKIKDA